MTSFIAFTVVGITTGAIYAVAASGLVVTYTTSGIFNFAHGAVGMILAFAYWELRINQDWPAPIALGVVLLVIGPLFGAVVERLLIRKLAGTSLGTSLVVTVGLLLTLLGVANVIWDPSVARPFPRFFGNNSVKLFTVNVSWHQLITIAVAIGVAAGLRLLFYRTRTGVAMRAVVDDRELAALNGAVPARVSQLSWAIGASLAGLAGILLSPLLALDTLVLTFLVVNGFAAAILGRLRSLPLTFAGALGLGLLEAYTVGYLSTGNDLLGKVKPALPTIFLFVVLLALPQTRLRAGRLVGGQTPRLPGPREAAVVAVGFVALAWVVSALVSDYVLVNASQGMALALMMLSLVVLTGYGGQVSLCQLTFVGVGAFVMGKVAGGDSIAGLLAAGAVAAVVGAVIALPALRLQGLYLALITLAFAALADNVFFNDSAIFGVGGSLPVGRISPFHGDRAYFVLLAAVFAAGGVLVLAIRRGAFGRLLSAMSDSPAACATLGLNLTVTKTAVFALSAGMAGMAGALYGGLRTGVTANDFLLLQSLVLLLLAYLGGINTVTGAFLGGMVFALFPVLQEQFTSLRSLTFLGVGLGAMVLGTNPDGMAGMLRPLGDRLRAWRAARAGTDAGEAGPEAEPVPPPHLGEEVERLAGARG